MYSPPTHCEHGRPDCAPCVVRNLERRAELLSRLEAAEAGRVAKPATEAPKPSTEPMTNARPSWDAYFMAIAQQVATRATCDRKHVGAIIVRERTILATGYNGSVRGMDHCDDVGHMMEGDGPDRELNEAIANVCGIGQAALVIKLLVERSHPHCVRTVHAEANAIAQAAKNGVRIEGASIYVTASPCWGCFKLIANAGIAAIYFGELYRDERITDFARDAGIKLVDLSA